MIDGTLTYQLFTFSGDFAGVYPMLAGFHLRSVVHLSS